MRYEYLFMWIYKGEPGCLSSISVSFRATRHPRLSVTGLQMKKRKTHPPPPPPSPPTRVFLQPPEHWGYWAGERACIDFDLNWATFMVNFTRAASSAHQFTPSHLAEGKWDSFFTGGIYSSVRTTYAPPRSLWREAVAPLHASRVWNCRHESPDAFLSWE